MTDPVQLDSLPMSLTWLRDGAASTSERGLTIEAPPGCDWFVDPAGPAPVTNAPALVGQPPDPDFTFAARVQVDAAATFDAGVLFLYADDTTWAKLCLERSPRGPLMVVSVVTRGTSDDCNSQAIDGDVARLRAARFGGAFAFHWSLGGDRWELVRHFALPTDDVQIGFEVQSPIGAGCRATFSEIAYASRRLGDLRDES